jgi:hypothetical protein
MLLNIDKISLNGGTQTRSELDKDHIIRLVEMLDSGVIMPAVELMFDGTAYWLVDGFHRVEAHKQADKTQIFANVSQGSQRDAVLASLSSNATHGLPRSREDRKRAVMRMLLDDEWSQWSNTKIARTCATTEAYVKRVRLETLPTIPGILDTHEPDALHFTLTHPATATAPTGKDLIRAATPGAIVLTESGDQGTIMDVSDGGAIFNVMVDGKMQPLLRTEFVVEVEAPKVTAAPEQRLSHRQIILEMCRVLTKLQKTAGVPAAMKSEIKRVLDLAS